MAEFVSPAGFEKWNPAMRGAFRKGWDASAAGQTILACPYKDKRKPDGRLTWSRALASAWCDGWDAQRMHDPISAYFNDRRNSGDSSREAHR